MRPLHHAFFDILAGLLLSGVAATTLASPTIYWGQYATVQSETDGNGLFTYALTAGTDPLTFIMGGNHFFELTFHGMQDIYDTPNWESSHASGQDIVRWTYTGADPLTLGDTPIVFSAQSTIPDARFWEFSPGPPYVSHGLLVGEVAPPDPYANDMFCGFSFIAPVPEPSSLALFLVGAASVGVLSRLRKRRAQRLAR